MSKDEDWIRKCPICKRYYIIGDYDMCRYCLLEKYNLQTLGRYDSCDIEGLGNIYYKEEDVLKAITRAEREGGK